MRSILNTVLERSVENLSKAIDYVSGNTQKAFVGDSIDFNDLTKLDKMIDDHDKVITLDKEYRTSNLIQLMDAYTLKRDLLYSYSGRSWHMANGLDSNLGNDFRAGYMEAYYTKLKENEATA